MSIAFATIFS